MSDQEIVEEIRSRADIVEVVGDYVSLKRSGAGFKGLCPFHTEKTPSFTVNPSRQIFHCFGCGAGGDVFSFVQRHDGLSFPEAVNILGERYGVAVPTRVSTADEGRERALALLNDAAGWFRRKFPGSPAEEYVGNRGLDEETVTAFGLGYAPEGWRNLTDFLLGKGYQPKDLKISGVVSEAKSGKLFDTFRNRLVFPIKDLHGRVVGFGGRVLGAGEPKYLNSPESPLFHKGRMLYGLAVARDGIRSEGAALLVEGYMDVLACYRHGIRNAVAALGTALTEQHAALIKRFAENVCLIFDSDTAGIRAAKRALPLLLEQKIDVKTLVLPGGDDPDTFLGREGGEVFRERIRADSKSIIDFLLDEALQGSGSQRARKALEIVKAVPTPIERSLAIRNLAERLNVGESALVQELRSLERSSPELRQTAAGAEEQGERWESAPREEIFLFALALKDPFFAERLVGDVDKGEFSFPPLQPLFVKLKRLLEGNSALEYSSFSDTGLSEAENRALTEAYSLDIAEDAKERGYADCLDRIRQRRDLSRIAQLKERIKAGDREAMKELMDVERRWKATEGEA